MYIETEALSVFTGTLKLDISPCPSEVKNCLTAELYKVDPYPDNHIRPIKEIIEFPIHDILEPYTTYRYHTFTVVLSSVRFTVALFIYCFVCNFVEMLL